jgi:hypothetical protein
MAHSGCWRPSETPCRSTAALFRYCALLVVLVVAAAIGAQIASAESVGTQNGPVISFAFKSSGQLAISADEQPVAVYVFADPQISRPYFAHVCAPGGIQVTRNHPPRPHHDLADHPTFHPGLWMSFGDISGSDYWRNAARVKHTEFLEQPAGAKGSGSFVVRNAYLSQEDPSRTVCWEVARYELFALSEGYLLTWDSTFSSDREFAFGDQEEMGLGIRVATSIRADARAKEAIAAGQGRILDSAGRENGEAIWGQTANWADYSGKIDGAVVGITLFCHPENFRPTWFHARDYGLLVANPFGRQAFGHGEASQVAVRPGSSFRLRYGVFLHSRAAEANEIDLKSAYQEYLARTSP